MEEKTHERKIAERKKMKAAATLNPVKSDIQPGKHSIVDLLLVSVYQQKIDSTIVEILNNTIQGFLDKEPRYLPIFLSAALWMNFGITDPLSKEQPVTERKKLKVYEAENKLPWQEDLQGVYRSKFGLYISKLSDEAAHIFIHELGHALVNLLYQNSADPFLKNSPEKNTWDEKTQLFISEVFLRFVNEYDDKNIKKLNIFRFESYDKTNWASELIARILEFKFLFPNEDWPIKNNDVIAFAETAATNLIQEANEWSKMFIEESGLILIDEFKSINFFKHSLEVSLSEDSANIINEARKDGLLVIDIFIKKYRKEQMSPELICEDLLQKGITSYALLQSATRLNDLELIKFVHKNYPIDVRDERCIKTLHHALRNNNSEIAEYLLFQMNIDPFQNDHFGRNMRTWFSYYNSDTKKLLKNYEIQHSIFAAIMAGRNDVALNHLNSIDINEEDLTYGYPLLFSLDVGNIEIFEHILNRKNVDVNVQTPSNDNALFVALDNKDFEYSEIKNIFLLLMKKGIQLDSQDSDELTILHKIVKNKNLSSEQKVELLGICDAKKLLNITDSNGRLALHLAVERKKNLKVVEYLLTQNPDSANYPSSHNQTPLHLAVNASCTENVNYLLNVKQSTPDNNASNPNFLVDVNVKESRQGYTALHIAVLMNNEEIIKKLLTRADLNLEIKDKNNKTAFDYLPEDKVKSYMNFRNFFSKEKNQTHFFATEKTRTSIGEDTLENTPKHEKKF